MVFPRGLAVFCLLSTGILFGCEPDDVPPSPEAMNWVSVDLVKIVGKSSSVEEARREAAQQFRASDVDGGGIGESDRKFQRGAETAQQRATALNTWLSRDLDGDGMVTRRELEQFFGPAALKLAHRAMTTGESLDELATKKRDERVLAELRVDSDKDGVVTIPEILALRDARMAGQGRLRKLVPPHLDGDGDGVVSEEEYLRVVDSVLKIADPNGDGEISTQEKSAYAGKIAPLRREIELAERFEREIEIAADMAPSCGFPKVSPGAQVILVENGSGTGLSTVGLGDTAGLVTVGDLHIEPGDEPLYVVLYGLTPMIWRFTGDTERVAQVIAGTQGRDASGALKAGVTGLGAAHVFIPEYAECEQQFAAFDEISAKIAARKLEAMLGRPVTGTLIVRTLHRLALPSGTVEKEAVLPGAMELPRNTPGELMWRATQHQYAGGLLRIDPGDVRSRARPAPYDLLPGSAGLAQLADRGAIEVLESSKRMLVTKNGALMFPMPSRILVREKIRVPTGMLGLMTFELAPGVPRPRNLPRGAKVVESAG